MNASLAGREMDGRRRAVGEVVPPPGVVAGYALGTSRCLWRPDIVVGFMRPAMVESHTPKTSCSDCLRHALNTSRVP